MSLCSLPWILAVSLVLLLGGATVAAANPPDFQFAPDEAAADFQRLSGTMWVDEGPNYAVRLQRIGESDRQTYIRRVTGSATDPFASAAHQAPRYMTFLVEVENSGGGELVLQPKNCWLITDKKQILHPIGLDDLSADFGLLDEEMSPEYEGTRPALLADSRLLGPGESISGLLVYSAVKPKTKRFQMDFVLMSSKGDIIRLRAAYRRIKKNKNDR